MIGRRAGCPGLYQSWVSGKLNGGGAWTSRIQYFRHLYFIVQLMEHSVFIVPIATNSHGLEKF